MGKVRVLLADDHRIVLDGLKSLLDEDYDVVGMVEDGRTLLQEAQRLHPNLIIVDISMPGLNGIEAVKKIKKKSGSSTTVIFLTMHNDPMYAKEAFDAGASGFVLKHSASDELLAAISEVLKGHTYISPAIAKDLMEFYKSGGASDTGSTFRDLTDRQREILQLLAGGKTAKEIAGIINVSVRTVEFHKYNMMKRLGIETNAELVQYAIKYGIISI